MKKYLLILSLTTLNLLQGQEKKDLNWEKEIKALMGLEPEA